MAELQKNMVFKGLESGSISLAHVLMALLWGQRGASIFGALRASRGLV